MDPTYSDTLQPADYNPRFITNEDAAALKASIEQLGDISGIVKNVATSNQVTGHQRISLINMAGKAEIVITWHADQPSASGTLAYGYICHPVTGERFSYREVFWPLDAVDKNGKEFSSKEKVANVAANRISGDWDLQKLAEVNSDLQQLDNGADLLKLTGQDDKEIEKLNKMSGVEEFGEEQPDEVGASPKDSDKRNFRATNEQWETIDEALEHIKATMDIPAEENGSRNGTALYYLAREHLDKIHGLANEAAPAPNTLSDLPA